MKTPVLPTPDERPVCEVVGCSRPVIMRDRTGLRIRWRRYCYYHHRRGTDTASPLKRKAHLTDGLHCVTKRCPRAPEAFVRPDGRVYIRPLCRLCRLQYGPAATAKRERSPRSPIPANTPPPTPLLGKHKRWQDTPLKKDYKMQTALVKGGVWVKDGEMAWFVPDASVREILKREKSSFDLAKASGMPSRVVVNLQSAASRGKLRT